MKADLREQDAGDQSKHHQAIAPRSDYLDRGGTMATEQGALIHDIRKTTILQIDCDSVGERSFHCVAAPSQSRPMEQADVIAIAWYPSRYDPGLSRLTSPCKFGQSCCLPFDRSDVTRPPYGAVNG